MPSIANVNGITLSYTIHESSTGPPSGGKAPPLVVALTGLSHDQNTLTIFQVPALNAAGFRVLTFDNRGVGGSTTPTEVSSTCYSTEVGADDLWALISHLGFDKDGIHLLGISMSGMVLQHYMIKYDSATSPSPFHVKSLIFVTTYIKGNLWTERNFILWKDLTEQAGLVFAMKDIATKAFSRKFVYSHPTEIEMFSKAAEASTQHKEGFLGQIHALLEHGKGEGEEQRITEGLREIQVPTIVIDGDEDLIIPSEVGKKVADAIPHASYHLLPGGHGLFFEYPDIFNETLVDFLKKIENQ